MTVAASEFPKQDNGLGLFESVGGFFLSAFILLLQRSLKAVLFEGSFGDGFAFSLTGNGSEMESATLANGRMLPGRFWRE